MWKLIKLEWTKNHVSKYILGAVIVTGVIGLLMFAQCYLGIANDASSGVPDSVPGMDTMAPQIELFTNLCFLIFTAAMMSSFIITPYMNKTMNLMFSYPIKRQKIVIAQMLSVWLFCFVALLVGKLLIYTILTTMKGSFTAYFTLGYNMADVNFYVQILLKTAVTVTLGFIALYVGTSMKSSKAAIITSFLLFAVMNGTVGDFSLRGNAIVPITLVIISLICAYLSIYKVETKDLK
ncbi:ABC transporter permease subunit [Anaeromicropila herbilytica]|uniref:Bacitracin ABC transporter permease n=1 Tax=Anaeromicropila herbilytica TaxID=2785025 RepID=A0A7R7EHY7_9FIRM|nr:ABC transporter permease subunit [Anaeromicropila herbilytica]BCN29068.1 bacitracin ABC transporter permease [Anaeromicropila herbilytica]